MADNSESSPMTPEITKTSGIELRRHSTGKASSENNEENVLPRYLRASTGSCHDFCKYGGKHAFEANENRSLLERVARKPVHQRSEKRVGGTKILVDELRASTSSKSTKKISSVKLTASVDSALQICETLGIHEHKHEMLTKSIENSKRVETEVSGNKKAALVKVKPLSSPKSHTSDLSKTRTKEMSSASKKVETSPKSTNALKAKEMKLSLKPNSVTGKTMLSKNPSEGFSGQRNSEPRMEKRVAASKVATRKSITPSRTSLSLKASFHRVASINTRKHKSLKIVPHLKDHSEKGKDNPNQHIYVEVEQKTRKNNPKQHSDVEVEQKTRKNNTKQHSDVEAEEKTRKDRPEQHSDIEVEEKTRKDRPEQHCDVEVEEKSLNVIKMAGEEKIWQSNQNASHDAESSLPQLVSSPKFSRSSSSQSSSQDDHEESEYTTSEVEEDSVSVKDEKEHIENVDDLEVDQNGKPDKEGAVNLEYKDGSQITKLKCIKGKWVEIKSERSSPSRLKFRRGRVLGETENRKGDAQRKCYKRRDGDVGESNDATTGSGKVVLRHQDVQGKKDEQGLFNNVIEETASKLAETRKSKVKALVGAFETVISLQEKKLSASTGI
ncbi:uncharacterized protein LOC129318137 [Prosopis cineraria]|uniref:uncharacterized protein LOC129318137 n=1 Tax=Prosopis cineraria TaxID=364024 RepID=UPI0024103296|nr:uncharacterized protein LOC129318137 [Prosopis cineraria]XP_054818824.1 uncharacterized protein LOC129318137 [Prosopis cineraria]XP_054818906.1 uncharacterized protein LOC129318137 [Prosopis cineraria]